MIVPDSVLSIVQKNRENLFSFAATLCRAFSRFLLVFIASLLLTRYEFGIFNIFISIYFFARLFSENSLNLPFIKFATDGDNAPGVVSFQVVILKILYVLAVSAVVLGCSDSIVHYSGLERKRLLFLIPLMLLTLTAYMFVGQVLIAQLKMRLLFFYELINGLVFTALLGGYYVCASSFSTERLIVLFSLSMAGSALGGGIVFRRLIQLTPPINRELIWKIVHYSKFTVLSGISSLVILKADVLMLGFFCTPREVAIYGMALFVNEAVNMVFDSVLRICLPKASALGTGADGGIRLLFRQSVKNIYIGIIPIAACIAVAAPFAINLVYQGKYDDSIGLVYLFLASSLIKPAGYVAGVILGATGHIRLDNRNCWIIALFNLVCNYFLIPRYDVMGAAVASILSFTLLTALNLFTVKKILFASRAEEEGNNRKV